MIMVQMADEQIGYVGELHALFAKRFDQWLAHAIAAAIQHNDPAMAAQQRNRAPTEAPMLRGFSGIALDQHINPPSAAVELHGAFL
jgi:hypothetical protein